MIPAATRLVLAFFLLSNTYIALAHERPEIDIDYRVHLRDAKDKERGSVKEAFPPKDWNPGTPLYYKETPILDVYGQPVRIKAQSRFRKGTTVVDSKGAEMNALNLGMLATYRTNRMAYGKGFGWFTRTYPLIYRGFPLSLNNGRLVCERFAFGQEGKYVNCKSSEVLPNFEVAKAISETDYIMNELEQKTFEVDGTDCKWFPTDPAYLFKPVTGKDGKSYRGIPIQGPIPDKPVMYRPFGWNIPLISSGGPKVLQVATKYGHVVQITIRELFIYVMATSADNEPYQNIKKAMDLAGMRYGSTGVPKIEFKDNTNISLQMHDYHQLTESKFSILEMIEALRGWNPANPTRRMDGSPITDGIGIPIRLEKNHGGETRTYALYDSSEKELNAMHLANYILTNIGKVTFNKYTKGAFYRGFPIKIGGEPCFGEQDGSHAVRFWQVDPSKRAAQKDPLNLSQVESAIKELEKSISESNLQELKWDPMKPTLKAGNQIYDRYGEKIRYSDAAGITDSRGKPLDVASLKALLEATFRPVQSSYNPLHFGALYYGNDYVFAQDGCYIYRKKKGDSSYVDCHGDGIDDEAFATLIADLEAKNKKEEKPKEKEEEEKQEEEKAEEEEEEQEG